MNLNALCTCVYCYSKHYFINSYRAADEDDFSFLPPGEERKIEHKETKERAKQAILAVYNEIQMQEEEEEQPPTCMEKLCKRKPREPKEEEEEEEDNTKLSPQMEKADSQGTSMIKKVFFPAMPSLLQDLWVYLEMIISFFAFAFGFVSYSTGVGTQRTFNILYLSLAVLSTVLALIDAFIYIFQLGSCARLFKYLYKKYKERRRRRQQNQEGDTENLNEERREGNEQQSNKVCGCIPRMPEVWLSRFNQFFELGRNVVSELLLYPLLICDMFDFVALGGRDPEDATDRVNFGLFCIGGFYLVLSVYIMRMFTIIGTMVSLMRLPLDTADGGKKQYINLMVRFCIHAVCQILVHLLAVLAVAAKIRNENPETLDDEDPINISPFLWAVIFLGWIVPLAGVITFFTVNYYWTKEFSISFWVDMISLLQGQGFAEAVFGGEGVSATQEAAEMLAGDAVDPDEPVTISQEAKEKTLDFVEKSGLKEVKKQLRKFKSPSFFVKLFHPLKLPLLSLTGLFYDCCLIAFGASIVLTTRDGNIQLAIPDDHLLFATFAIVMTCIVIANLQILIVINVGFLVIFFLTLVATIYILIALPFIIFIYIPISCILGTAVCFRSLSRAMNIFKPTGMKPQHTHLKLTKRDKSMIKALYQDNLF